MCVALFAAKEKMLLAIGRGFRSKIVNHGMHVVSYVGWHAVLKMQIDLRFFLKRFFSCVFGQETPISG